MASDPRVMPLLEEIVASERTPEEVCRTCPELLAEVRVHLERVRAVEAAIAQVFPSHPTSATGLGASPRAMSITLPNIKGYAVLGVLGHGGMGVVYKARHLKLDRIVAIKMLLSGSFAAPAELTRFTREAQALAGLRHPHIIQVHDVGEIDGRPYFTMEYVEGGSLAQALAGVPQPPRHAAMLVATLAAAVQIAHDGGIVHRDLKPANVLLTSEGTPKITDFGLARRYNDAADLTLAGTRLGTPSYMSPEQAAGREGAVGPATDIYSLGAVLYEMLTGRPPFRADTPTETQRQLLSEEPARPSHLNSKIPRDLETICLKCLNKDPERRYLTAASLGADLQRYLRGETITARRASSLERASKWAHRKPAHALALATSALLVLGVLGAGAWALARTAETSRAVQADLIEINRLEASSRWTDAGIVLERAKVRLGGGGRASLRRLLQAAADDLNLVSKLDAIRRKQLIIGASGLDRVASAVVADHEYDAAFRDAGLILAAGEDAARVATRVRASRIHPVLIEALDDWSQSITGEHDYDRRRWLMTIARLADPDPAGWRDKARDPDAWYDAARLAAIADAMPPGEQLLALPLALGERLGALGGDSAAFLKRIQAAHPADFWANFALGQSLRQHNPEQALGYFRAMVASRPDVAEGYANIGLTLGMLGEVAESESQLRAALQREPNMAFAHANLGFLLLLNGRTDEAISELRQASVLNPSDANIRVNFGAALEESGRFEEAKSQFREALTLDPHKRAALLGVERCDAMLALEPRLDAVLQGAEVISDPSERVRFASLSRYKGRFAEAAHLYADSFAADPALAEDIMRGLRYEAACAAALAGVGAGAHAPGPAEQAKWREQARAWLQADIDVMRPTLMNDTAPRQLRDRLTLLLSSPVLAGIRDPEAIAALPQDEQAKCLALWSQVRDLQHAAWASR
ncbi:MAG: protein kinase [Tepidisphaera sp.]|nr:protein kinase [Tepidisphaera sp.]